MLNRSVNQVANGRRLAARRVVMNALASIPAQIWRKEVVFNNPAEDSKPLDPLSLKRTLYRFKTNPTTSMNIRALLMFISINLMVVIFKRTSQ